MFTACFLTNCKKIICINDGLYYYRNRPGSAVNSFNSQRKESIKIVHTELEKYIDQWGMPELKPIHHVRKVRGWMMQLRLLLNHKKMMSNQQFRDELISMSEDPYFRNSYRDMEKASLSLYDHTLAKCLYKKQYLLISVLHITKKILSKANLRRNYVK